MAREQMKKPDGGPAFTCSFYGLVHFLEAYHEHILAKVIEALPGARTAGERRYKAEAIKKLREGL